MEGWNGVLLLWNVRSMSPDVVVYSDASGSWGSAALCKNEWFQLKWESAMPGYSIAHKELIPIVTGVLIWGSSWYGKMVQFISDNEAVVVVLNGLYARDEKIMHAQMPTVCGSPFQFLAHSNTYCRER